MTPEVLAYPFLFIAIFFESFILVTFLSKPARDARRRVPASGVLPRVAVIVPCYNEESTIAGTCESLLTLDYPADKLEILLVDDGSTDGTPEAMSRFAGNPQVTIIRKENGGKHTALNTGIAATSAEIVGCLDADSFVDPAALKEIVPCFENPAVAATTAAMSVHRPKNMLEHMQNAEYVFGITLRHAAASVNGLYVTPGPFSFYRRSVIEELGGFRHGYQTEDLEMALRIQKAGHLIDNAPRARVYTKAPKTVWKLIKQRTRWTTGFMRNVLYDYRGLVGDRRYGALGAIVLPIGLTAIASGMLLFFIAAYSLISHLFTMIAVRQGIPLAYALSPRLGSFDWFYLPSSMYVLLGIATVLASVSMIVVGKRISKTPMSLSFGVISYLLLYGFVVPFWLMRATSDVALGRQRRWK
jgi:cellulose synthase/poly-beta-1,6-N-acetylglucosamine synthase-like glycosyltransferase